MNADGMVTGDLQKGLSVATIGEDFPKQQERVRTILGYYKEIGPAGAFGAAIIEDVLRRADRAAISGDVVAMVAVYQEMVDLKE